MKSKFISIMLIATCAVTGCNRGEGDKESATPTAKSHSISIAKPPVMMTGDSMRTDYMAAHYWRGMDMTDTTWATDTAALEEAVANWTALVQLLPARRGAELTAEALRRAGCTPALQRQMYEVTAHYFCHPNSPYRDEAVCRAIRGTAASAAALSPAEKEEAARQLALMEKNGTGTKAEDFEFLTREWDRRRLSDIKARYILLMFYDPSCEECRRTEEEIAASRHISAMTESGSMAVVAIYPDADFTQWRKHAPSMPESWTVGCDTAQAINRQGLYHIAATPALYLLDRTGRVLLKETDVQEIVRYTSTKP